MLKIEFLLLLGISLSPISAWASCEREATAGGGQIVRIYPWPEVPGEMMDEIKRLAGQSPQNERSAPFLEQALGQASPDHVVHALLGNKSLAAIRKQFYLPPLPEEVEIEGLANISIRPIAMEEWDFHSHSILADAIGAIHSDQMKLAWIKFMMKDGERGPRESSVNKISTLKSQELRDAFAREFGLVRLDYDDVGMVHIGIAKNLTKISSQLRWQLIKYFAQNAQTSDVDREAKRALSSFVKSSDSENDPQTLILKSWYSDQEVARRLDQQMHELGVGPISDQNEFFSAQVGLNLSRLKSSALRAHYQRLAISFANGSGPNRQLANNILTEIKLNQILSELNLYIKTLPKGPLPDLHSWKERILAAGDSPKLRRFAENLEDTARMYQESSMAQASNISWDESYISNFEPLR